MGPIIICDKCTLQGLALRELNLLRKYYYLNIPPVLLIEILADLKKSEDPVKGQAEVRKLAAKLVPACSAVNTDFRSLIRRELLGSPLKADGRPVLSGAQHVLSPEGKSSVVFDHTGPNSAEEALLRWQCSAFNEAETLLAQSWREITKGIDLEGMQRTLRKQYSSRLNLTNLAETANHADDLIASANGESANAKELLLWFIRDAGIPSTDLEVVIQQICDSERFGLEARLPYTTYCLRLALIFHFGLAFRLIGTRSTNRVDLEYLYYVPFGNAFSTGDNQLAILAQHAVRDNQMFIPSNVLKTDLRQIVARMDSMAEDERAMEVEKTGPPENDDSVTHQIWRRFMKRGYRENPRLEKTLPPETLKSILDYCVKKLEGTPSNQPIQTSIDDCDFVARKHNVRLDGPCICGSDKVFADCCGKNAG